MGEDLPRRTKVLQTLLLSMFFLCLAFTVFNGLVFPVRGVTLVNALSTVLALIALIYFRITGKYEVAAHLTMGMILVCMIAYFHVVQNQHYAFIWIGMVPPIAYYLLNNRSVRVFMALFGLYMLYFFISGLNRWGAAEFDVQSIISIAGATLCSTGMLANLVKNRNDVMAELRETGLKLENQQSDLRLILDSAAEAIYGIDLEGKCTFCNRRCIDLLGYHEQSDLLGQNMHWLIHHSRSDGTPIPISECNIFNAFIHGEGTHMDHEVFWRADQSCFTVEYYSYPQIKNGEIVGAVVTFTDSTERKKKESEIDYLNRYDVLTGLQNRRCFEENRDRMDNPDNLPISIIFADINGLKMTNDIFGHSAGDELIKKSAGILKQACRQQDLVARVGGDEFIVLLPKTSQANAEKIVDRIKTGFLSAKVEAIKCSIALGLETKQTPEQPLAEVLANAENAMYRDKTINRRTNNKDIIDTIIETLHARNAKEQRHSLAVSELCFALGTAMHLEETDISKLQRAGYLHDIGKVVLDAEILNKAALSEEERERMQQHSAIGYRILNLFDDTLDLAEYIYGHHERWDGTGYPRGLQGEQIPLISRIIAVVESYDRLVSQQESPTQEAQKKALDEIRERSGTQFDPAVVQAFIAMMQQHANC